MLGTLAAVLQDFYRRQSIPLRSPGGNHEGAGASLGREGSSPESSCVSVSGPDTEGNGVCGKTSTGEGGGEGRVDLNHPHGLLTVPALTSYFCWY